jgi:D-serine deaminase-like pyridoxal phosphate-dependent protein
VKRDREGASRPSYAAPALGGASQELVVERYSGQLGRAREEVQTPALLLDLDAARRNIERMASRAAELGTALRPHAKSHKSPELARMQIAAGAIGVACATVWEAVVMARVAGIEDVLVTSQVVGEDKLLALAELAGSHRVTVAVDDARNIRQLSQAAAAAGSVLDLLIEVDVGMGRSGVRTADQALPLAAAIHELPAVRFRGVQGYEGHCMGMDDPEARDAATLAANGALLDVADALAAAGHVSEVVSAGGTGTYATTGANPHIDEVQAGSYLFMDRFHERLVPGEFELALTVLGQVVSRQGSTVVLDCGRKTVSIELGNPPLVGHDDATVRVYAEEHCLVDFPGAPPLDLGDTAEVWHSYAPTGVNLHDVFHVLEGGVVTAIWPVNPRGPGPPSV